jgi:hypothetical protein
VNTTFRFVLSTVAATVALTVVLGIGVLSVERAFALYVLAIGAISVLALVRVAGAAASDSPSFFEESIRARQDVVTRPADLLRVERDLVIGTSSAGAADSRLLPMLRAAAAARLSAHHGVELDRRPEAARALLGDAAWELLRPDRAPALNRGGPGIPERDIGALADVLERL